MSVTTFPGFMFARLLALSFSLYTTATSNNGGNDNFACFKKHCFVLNRPKEPNYHRDLHESRLVISLSIKLVH